MFLDEYRLSPLKKTSALSCNKTPLNKIFPQLANVAPAFSQNYTSFDCNANVH